MTKTFRPRRTKKPHTHEPKPSKDAPKAKKPAAQTTVDDHGGRAKKQPKASPTVVLSEAQREERLIESLDHKITGAKENLKELKALREGAVSRMRTIVREQKQTRMFDQDGRATKEALAPAPDAKKGAKPDEAAARKDAETVAAVEEIKSEGEPKAA